VFLAGASTTRGIAQGARAAPDTLQPIDEALDRLLGRLFPVPDHAITVGRHYLREHPDQSRRAYFPDELQMELETLVAADHDLMIRRIDELRQRDFSAGRTVLVDRWVLSRTEAQLCALRALL
jgi:hypothetical protein